MDRATPTILIVEDDPTLCEVLHVFLEDDGFRVLSTNSGRVAVELAHTEALDLITLDLTLPDMEGADVLRGIELARGEAAVPILVLSGQDRLPPVAGPIAGVLAKPFNIEQLQALIHSTLSTTATVSVA